MSNTTELRMESLDGDPIENSTPQVEESETKIYPRAEAMKILGISSRSTLAKYCNQLNIPRGFKFFTENEFQQLSDLNAFRKRGGHFKDYLNYQGNKNCA